MSENSNIRNSIEEVSGMSKRVSVVLQNNVAADLEQLATDERRSQSQMGAILIEEALKARKELQEMETTSAVQEDK
ncbi:MAG: hypothetical protein F6K58_02035 [Symploca sp. SIO2E9]|nr:hypothetical protein [Symploca sp. SIO2E9]